MCFTAKRIYDSTWTLELKQPQPKRHTCRGRVSPHQKPPPTDLRTKEAESSSCGVKTHKRMILELMSGLKGNGEGKLWLSLGAGEAASPSSDSCCGHEGRVWTSTNWERAPRGSIPSGTAEGAWTSKRRERKSALALLEKLRR